MRRPPLFFFSSRRRHTRSVSAFLLNRSSETNNLFTATKCRGLVSLNQVIKEIICLRSEERRVGKECRSEWAAFLEVEEGEEGVCAVRGVDWHVSDTMVEKGA